MTQNDIKRPKTSKSKAKQNEKQTGTKFTQNDQKQAKTYQCIEWVQNWAEKPKRSETTQNDPKRVKTS